MSGGSVYHHELFEEAELVLPPSKSGIKAFKLYREVAVTDAVQSIEYSDDPLALAGVEYPAKVTAKIVLTQYITARKSYGLPKVTRYSEPANNSKRPLLNTVDFCVDVDLCAKRAFAKRPALLKLFTVLVLKEYGKRLKKFADAHPKTFNDLLMLLGTELRKPKTGFHNQSAYMRVTR
jgi:hypothetical protein